MLEIIVKQNKVIKNRIIILFYLFVNVTYQYFKFKTYILRAPLNILIYQNLFLVNKLVHY